MKRISSFFHKSSSRGFTLIELLIVIAIIGILTSVVLVSINTARAKARDSQRLQDMRQIKNALELYLNQYGVYPTCTGASTTLCATTPNALYGTMSTLAIVPGFISKISNDPKNIAGSYGYYYARGWYKTTSPPYYLSSGLPTDYLLGTRFETISGTVYNGWDNPNANYLDSNRTN